MSTRRDNPYWRSKHERISEAAFDEFTASGFEQASMEKIAERAGVSKVTVYNHFETKDRLFIQSFEYFFEFIYQAFVFDKEAVHANGASVSQKFIEALVAHFLHPSHQSMFKLLLLERVRLPMLGITKSEQDLFPNSLIKQLSDVLPFESEQADAVAELIFSLIYRRCQSVAFSEGVTSEMQINIADEIAAIVQLSGMLS